MKRILMILGIISIVCTGYAQNNKETNDFEEFRKQIHKDYDDFRTKINEEFVEFVRNPWKEFKSEEPVVKPKDDKVPPVVIPEEDKNKKQEDRPVVIEEVVEPQPVQPQPQPVQPIKEVPVIEESKIDFTFFGTTCSVRFDEDSRIRLKNLSPNAIADGFKKLTSESYDNLITDCLDIRQKMQLCDWAYLEMLRAMSDAIYGSDTNESTLLMSYVYLQSGYRMRIAKDKTKLYMLFASNHHIYAKPYYVLDGNNFYCIGELPGQLDICEAIFPGEQNLSLRINTPQLFSNKPTPSRSIKSERFPEINVTSTVNNNLIEFYSTYPSSFYNDDMMTRWALYANTPMQLEVKTGMYVSLKQMISGRTQVDAVNRLLNFVQTGFTYEFDDKVWGEDRAFFPEETLCYPYCDCEDRSILFTRLIRDLLGLDCVLVYYPGHLATAVKFTEIVSGDYIYLNGSRFVVCDPTYIGAPVGHTMPEMDNKSAKVILLDKLDDL